MPAKKRKSGARKISRPKKNRTKRFKTRVIGKMRAKPKTKSKTKTKSKSKAKKSSTKRKSMIKNALIALGLLGLGTGAFMLLKPKKNSDTARLNEFDSSTSDGSFSPSPSGSGSTFPLKEGSRSEAVRQLQNALIRKYGKSILPRFGADGWMGKETISALRSKGLKTNIDAVEFKKLIA
jgi:hypothetical protein